MKQAYQDVGFLLGLWGLISVAVIFGLREDYGSPGPRPSPPPTPQAATSTAWPKTVYWTSGKVVKVTDNLVVVEHPLVPEWQTSHKKTMMCKFQLTSKTVIEPAGKHLAVGQRVEVLNSQTQSEAEDLVREAFDVKIQ